MKQSGKKEAAGGKGRRRQGCKASSPVLLEEFVAATTDSTKKNLFLNLIGALHSILDFEDAFILQMQDNQRMLASAATSAELLGTLWEPDSLFKRVLSGKPVVAAHIDRVSEWADQPEGVRKHIGSALHISLPWGRLAIFVVTHPDPGFFRGAHIRQLQQFAPLVSQALLTLDLQRAVVQRDRFFQLSMDLMGIVDYFGNFKQVNDSWKNVLGYEAEAFYRKNFFSFVHKDDVRMFVDAFGRLRQTGEQHMVEGRFRRGNGAYCWLSCSLAAYPDERLCYIVARDVTDRVVVEQQLAFDARHDPLTGLYNRIEFMERLDIAFARSLREAQYAFAIFYLDLNGFKAVNDTLGHAVGDALLKEVSLCLLDVVREVDTVARFGGDEFTILLDGVGSREQMLMVINRIHEKMRRPFLLLDHRVATSVSIGVAVSSPSYTNAEHILRDADMAMYQAKTAGDLPYILVEKNSAGCRSKRERKQALEGKG